jgi:hypothetical protein
VASDEWRERKRINTEDTKVESAEKRESTGLKLGHYKNAEEEPPHSREGAPYRALRAKPSPESHEALAGDGLVRHN